MKNPRNWRIALALYLAGLAIVGFWPTPVDRPIQGTLAVFLSYVHKIGVPEWVDYQFLEASANVAMFIPFGVLAALALPKKTWTQLSVIGLLASVSVELGQLLFIAARFASPLDIVTNTFGAVIGIATIRCITCRRSQNLVNA